MFVLRIQILLCQSQLYKNTDRVTSNNPMDIGQKTIFLASNSNCFLFFVPIQVMMTNITVTNLLKGKY
ncbi:Uncharacterised protein [Segatella copri]|nr:Uncharacterised protein [Segatella copri]